MKPRKPQPPSVHPKYKEMISAAIASLKERGGSSRQAILKYIMGHYQVGRETTKINAHLKMALRSGTKSGGLKQSKGTGASGSFRLGEKPKATAKPKPATGKKSQTSKKPAAKKAASKTAAKRKATTPKKVVKAKSAAAKKAVKKSPKKVALAKKAKSPKKLAKPTKKAVSKKSPAKKASKAKLSKK
ncbi:histone H1-delta-like [Littorina saxatilis]|uniref:histone H1-delta-like n=1 Tax=Littorina saxatilis TaxID=31220 RepID=UPI0038B48021